MKKAIFVFLAALFLAAVLLPLTVSGNVEEEKEVQIEKEIQIEAEEIDKPEYHVEATEPQRAEPFDSNDLEWDYDYVFRVVGAECRGEPADGIMAVCQCISNTAEHDGITPEEVVKRAGQYATPLASSFYDGGELVNECMLRVFACGERVVEDDIEFFCTVSCNSQWHNSLRYVTTIGNHKFFAR